MSKVPSANAKHNESQAEHEGVGGKVESLAELTADRGDAKLAHAQRHDGRDQRHIVGMVVYNELMVCEKVEGRDERVD